MALVSVLKRFPAIWVLLAVAFVSSPQPCEGLTIAPAGAAAAGLWTWYKSALVTNPLLTKSLTSSCIMSASDVMCQEVVARAKPAEDELTKLDKTRVLHVAITGALWSGPITHYWYIVLEK